MIARPSCKVMHIIPYDGIGGVESAARTMGCGRQGNFEFVMDFIFTNVITLKSALTTFNPLPIFAAAWRASRNDVDLIIVSLWRSAIVGLIAKLLRPKLKLVVFLHLPSDVHLLDFIFTRLSVRLATEVWADSKTTMARRVPGIRAEKCRVISFVTRRFETVQVRPVSPSFIFWGRITRQKGLDRAIHIFSAVHKQFPDGRFWVVGPDGGDMHFMQQLCISLGLKEVVVFLGAMTLDEISCYARQASFYLQTSIYEGMAMSVVESMQLGLVPVVTPVGEIGSYCRCGENSVFVKSDAKAVEDILNLLNTNVSYQMMRTNAIATWKDQPLYRDSVLKACEDLVKKSHEQY